MSREQKLIEILIPTHLGINEQFGHAISYIRDSFRKIDKNNELDYYGSDMPVSSVQIYSDLGITRALFNYSFKEFLKYSKKQYNKEIKPILKVGRINFYSVSDVSDFVVYYNTKKRNIIK